MAERTIEGVLGVSYEYAELIIRCDRECWHDGACVTDGWGTDFAPDW